MIGEGHTCDIWKPTNAISDRNEYLNADFTLLYSNVICRFHELSSQQRLEIGMGIDLSQDMQAVVIKGDHVSALDQYYMLYWKQEGSFWLITRPIQHTTVPKEYWKAYMEQVKVVQAEVQDHYA